MDARTAEAYRDLQAWLEQHTYVARFDVDGEMRIQSWDPGAAAVYGLPEEEAIGIPHAMLSPPDEDASSKVIREALVGSPQSTVVERVDRNGRRFREWLRAAPRGEQVACEGHPVPDPRAVRASIEQLTAAARSAAFTDEVYRQSVVHALKGPIDSLVVLLQVLNDKGVDYADRGLKLAYAARDMLAGYRTFSCTALNHAVETVDFDALMHDVRRALRAENGTRVQGISWSGGGSYDGDPALLRTLLGNLIQNAFDAGSSRVNVVATPTSVTVTDDGPGMPRADPATLFHPYPRGTHGRGGIGLAVARKIALLHGGDLTYEPSEQGARFRIQWRDDHAAH